MENEEFLKSMEDEMQILQKEFNDIQANMEAIVNESNQLQEKYNKAAERREQIRGEYTGIFKIYSKLKNSSLDGKKSNINNVTSIENGKIDKSKTKTTKNTKTEQIAQVHENEGSTITPEQQAKLTEMVNNLKKKDVNNNDIPDYLQSEYDKLNK